MNLQNIFNYQFSPVAPTGNNKAKAARKTPKRRKRINYLDTVYRPKPSEEAESENPLCI